MKKFMAMLLAATLCLGMVACGGNPSDGEAGKDDLGSLEGTYDITMWVSEIDGVTEMTQEMIDAFEKANPGIVINASIEGDPEGDAG